MKKKFLDKNGLSKLVSLIKPVERVFTGSNTEWEHADKTLYDVAKVRGNDTSGTIMCSGRPVVDDLNPVTSNAVKRKLGSWYGEISADPHPDFASAPGFDMRPVYLCRSGNSGLIYMRPMNGTYGTNANSTSDSYGPSTKYGLVTLTMPAGMKLSYFWYNGSFGDVYSYSEHVGATVEQVSRTSLSVSLWIYPNDGQGHGTDEGIVRAFTWITIPVLFDDDWPWQN